MENEQITFDVPIELARPIKVMPANSPFLPDGIISKIETLESDEQITLSAPEKDIEYACNLVAAYILEEKTDGMGRAKEFPQIPKPVWETLKSAHEKMTAPPY
jgi:hypothetical protein